MRLLIGAPCLKREWIIEAWFLHVFQAIAALDATPEIAFLFVGGENDPTFAKIGEICKEAQVRAYVEYVDEPRDLDKREWNNTRYQRMVRLRNLLLGKVREFAPDYFLSLDTDILLHPEALKNLLESSVTFDAVGGRCYMTSIPDERLAPSCMMIGRLVNTRPDIEGVASVDVIMAIKLMSPEAYMFDYEFDEQGEDLGISRVWREAGLKIGYDGRVCSKHVMAPGALHVIDGRCGF
jgi:hypothetical protein